MRDIATTVAALAVPEVVDALAAIVRQGSRGDRLPPERALAEELGIGRALVRRALLHLDDQGLVLTRPQAGSFIR